MLICWALSNLPTLPSKTFSALLPYSPMAAAVSNNTVAAVLSSPPIVMLLPMAVLSLVPIATGSNCDHPMAPVLRFLAKKTIAILSTNCSNTFGTAHPSAHHVALSPMVVVGSPAVAVLGQMATAAVVVLLLVSAVVPLPMSVATAPASAVVSVPMLPVTAARPMGAEVVAGSEAAATSRGAAVLVLPNVGSLNAQVSASILPMRPVSPMMVPTLLPVVPAPILPLHRSHLSSHHFQYLIPVPILPSLLPFRLSNRRS